MARSIEELTKEVLALPSASRAMLAKKLVESLEFDVDEEIQTAWLDKAEKRIEEVRTGKVQPIPGEEVLAEVRETAKRNREEMLMEQLSKTEAVVWSPQTNSTGDLALSELLAVVTDSPPLVVDGDGLVRVSGTRVTLDTVVTAFLGGATAEEILEQYPSLQRADIYSAIGYYLRHQTEVDLYLKTHQKHAAEVRQENERRFNTIGIHDRLLYRRLQQG